MSAPQQNGTPEPGLRRVLGPLDAMCIVVGAIVGVGIFFNPTDVARLAGSGGLALVAWAVGGAIALLGALTFAELGGLYPRSGGQYEILRDAYGPPPAFLFVFCNATAIQAGATAIIAIICAQHLAIAVGAVSQGLLVAAVAAGLIIGLITANCLGVRWGAGIQNLTVVAKIATLLVVSLLAALFGTNEVTGTLAQAESARPALGVSGALFAALVPVLFAFGGWQHALWMAGEVRRPRRDVPLSIVGGVVLVVILYLLVNWAYLRLLGYDGVAGSTALAAEAVAAVAPKAGSRLIAAAVAVSAFGVLNAQLLSGPRLVYGMARDGRFFRIFAWVPARFGTPVPAIILIGGAALVLLAVSIASEDAVGRLVTGVVFIDAIFFVLTGAALIVLRYRRPDADRPVRVPGYPVVPLLFVVGELCVITGAALDPKTQDAALAGAAWVVAAIVCYVLFFRRRREP